MLNCDKRGIILFIVISVIMVVVVFTAVVLRIISNHTRLTHHQVSRIQAQYAAKAGVIYALDKLRRKDAAWTAFPVTKRMCKTVWAPDCSTPDILEYSLPKSVLYVDITAYDPAAVWPNNAVSGCQKVSAKATFTYN